MKKSLLMMLALAPMVAASEECRGIKEDLKRLACYDMAASKSVLAARDKPKPKTAPKPEGAGQWKVIKKKDSMDDSDMVLIYARSEEEIYPTRRNASLNIRCLKNTTDLYVDWEDYLADNNKVYTRIGRDKAKAERWSHSADSKSLFRRKPISFIKKLMKAEKVIFRTQPYNSGDLTVTFDIKGLENAIKPLREACHW
jgi:type VI secretion system protein VasI